MSLERLNADWREWLRLNVTRGCADASLLSDMVRGGIPEPLALAALREARRANAPSQAQAALALRELPALPGPDLSRGEIAVRGARVRVRASLRTPQVALLDGVLKASECKGLIELGASRVLPVAVVDPATGQHLPHGARTGVHAHLDMKSSLLDRVEARLAELLRWPVGRFENLQVIRYEPGQEYRPHFDWFDAAQPGGIAHLRHGGQRVGTLIMYLMVPSAGGGTAFPEIGGLAVAPAQGSAVWFRNVDAAGQPDRATLHAGEAVTSGVKWIATVWLRERPWRAG